MGTVRTNIRLGGGGATIIDEWKPDPNWYDIEKILEEDTEDYPAKVIMLLADTTYSTGTIQVKGANKYKLSNGLTKTVTNSDTAVSFTVEEREGMFDKQSSSGYKTGYIIYYFPNEINDNNSLSISLSPLYIIFDKYVNNYTGTTLSCLKTKNQLEAVKFKNGAIIKYPRAMFSDCINLKTIVGIDDNFLSYDNVAIFLNCTSLKQLTIDATLNANSGRIFEGCSSLTTIKGRFILQNSIDIHWSNLTYESIINIINQLAQGSYKLTLGDPNLYKLSTEDKLKITSKGWTYA